METKLDINKLWFDENKIFIQTKNKKKYAQSLLWYKRLLNATEQQRNNYYFSYSGIHFPDIDEDISFESFLRRMEEPIGISKLFLMHPELNVSAVARRLGMSQSLLSAYINGLKKPSRKRETEIKNVVKAIGEELVMV
ncbi:MAG: DUF2442 domain-containing protein [Bacteroidales bacterium]|nr:DUF2442 domain-containing protein [Bacteroidales bacterium]